LILAQAQSPSIHGEHTIRFSSVEAELTIVVYWDPGNDRSRIDYANTYINETIWRRFDNNVVALLLRSQGADPQCCQMAVFGSVPYQSWIGTKPTDMLSCGSMMAQFYTGLWYEGVAMMEWANIQMGFAGSQLVCVRYKSPLEDMVYPVTYISGTPDPTVFDVNFPPQCMCTLSSNQFMERLSVHGFSTKNK